MHRHRHLLAALLVVPVLAAAGCGGDDDGSSGYASKDPAPVAAQSTPAASRAGAAVTVKGFAFGPQAAEVKVGQTVTWTNQDAVPHNVVADAGEFESETFAKGETYRFTPKKAGTISYVCTLHPGMAGKLVVTE